LSGGKGFTSKNLVKERKKGRTPQSESAPSVTPKKREKERKLRAPGEKMKKKDP